MQKMLAYCPNGVPKTAPPTGVAGAGSESMRGSSVITIKSTLNWLSTIVMKSLFLYSWNVPKLVFSPESTSTSHALVFL